MSDGLFLALYLTIMPRVDRDGWWTQEGGGFDNHENRWNVTATAGYRFGRARVMLADMGKFSNFLAFTPDDANYDANNANGCSGECLPTVWGYNVQRSQLLGIVGDYGESFALRVGAGIKRDEWEHYRHDSSDGQQSKTFSMVLKQTEYNLASVLGVAYRFRGATVVAQYIRNGYRIRQDGYVCCPPSKEAWQVGVER